MSSSAASQKAAIRQATWDRLTREKLAAFPMPIQGRIPNFQGAAQAARQLAETSEFQDARVIKVNPDAPQHPVRVRVLASGKTLLVPTPRLRGGFHLLDPNRIDPRNWRRAATIGGVAEFGTPISLDELPHVDLMVMGSVAVSAAGTRVGKGEGFAELEYAVLRQLGRIEEGLPIATTVHDVQVVAAIPSEPFDVAIDLIATPTRLIRTERTAARPQGILWDYLSEERLDAMPILRELKART